MKGYFILLLIFLAALFIYNKYGKKIEEKAANTFGYSQDENK